jgi:putative acetyltransferase
MPQIYRITGEGPQLEIVRTLFADYQQELGENLCFQNFDAEVANPLLKYAPPMGLLILAQQEDKPAGCIALQPLTEAGVCEMKRLYVPPGMRGKGIGEHLVVLLINEARLLGYHTMRLDTLTRLQSAIKIYKGFGFTEVAAYNNNPLPGVVYMEKKL